MATSITFNGANYSVPAYGDSGWAQGAGNLSSYLVAIAAGTLQTTGGAFTLSAEVDFGATYGLKVAYLKSETATPSTTGVLRLAKTDGIGWKNNAGSGDILLAKDTSDNLTWNGVIIPTAPLGIVPVTAGGTGVATLTAHGVMVGEGTSAVAVTAAGTAGAPLLSGGASADPAFGALNLAGGTSLVTGTLPIARGGTNSATALSGSSIMVSNGSAVIQGAAGTATTLLHGNAAGAPTYSAVSMTADVTGTLPVSNGGTGAATLTAHGVLLGEGTSAIAATTAGTTGQALVSGGASADPAFATLGVTGGGTGATTLTAHGVVVGNGTSAVAVTAAGSSGQPLLSGGASADPAYGTLGVAAGGTGDTSLTAYSVLCGGTTTTGAVQSVASVGTSAQVLTSNGAGALPTFQAAPGQGAWVDFTPSLSGSGSMTVGAGTVQIAKYLANGGTMFLTVYVYNITIGGTPSTDIIMTLPASKLGNGGAAGTARVMDNSTWDSAVAVWSTANGVGTLIINRGGGGNWTAGTSVARFIVNLVLPIQ